MNGHRIHQRATQTAFVAALWGCTMPVFGQSTEQQVKAAFIYNFMKFVTWPPSAFPAGNNSIVINIVGEDSLAHALDGAVDNKIVQGRSVVVHHVSWREAEDCQILFVPASESDHSLVHLRNHPILIIGESSGFAKRGGTINFVEEGGRVRFEISVDAAREAGLTISSRLLSLAKTPG